MKDLGEVDIILSIKVEKYGGGYILCQSHYIEKVNTKSNYVSIKEVNTLLVFFFFPFVN